MLNTEAHGVPLPFSSVGNHEGSGCVTYECVCVGVWIAGVLGSRVGRGTGSDAPQTSEAPQGRKEVAKMWLKLRERSYF